MSSELNTPAAVARRVAELTARGGPTLDDFAFARLFLHSLASKATKTREAADAITHGLTLALAIASFVPGGIEWGRRKYRSTMPDRAR